MTPFSGFGLIGSSNKNVRFSMFDFRRMKNIYIGRQIYAIMKNLDGIKNIFFDLGGVLLEIDLSKTFDAFEALGIADAHKINDRDDVSQLFIDFECGKYHPEEFLRLFRSLAGLDGINDSKTAARADTRTDPGLESVIDEETGFGSVKGHSHPTDEQITEAFCALLRDYIPENIALVQRLSKDYRVFLLSNTNALHAAHFNAVLERDFGIRGMDQLMERAFYSHDLGFRKPDIRVFKKAMEQAGVLADESLFIDDLEDNIIAARKAGMRAVKVDARFSKFEVRRVMFE